MSHIPKTLAQFPGQSKAKAAILPSVEAARSGKRMSHILLVGPPGLGKTTLAHIIANELGGKCVVRDARSFKTFKDFLDVVQNLSFNDVLFVDEIHGFDKKLEERCYDPIDNFGFWLSVGTLQTRIPLPQFVLVGATTRLGEVSGPLRTRFGVTARLEFYSAEELQEIAYEHAGNMSLLLTEDAAERLAACSRGTARVLTKLLDRCDDIAVRLQTHLITLPVALEAIHSLSIHDNGLTDQDIAMLRIIRHNYGNKPVALSTLSAVVGENAETLESTVEPYLLQQGLIIKTTRGRMLTDAGMEVAA